VYLFVAGKEVLQKEKGRRLCYICIYGLGLKPLPVAPLVLKFGIHLGQAGRKGVRGERKRDGVGGQKASVVRDFTTLVDWAAACYPHALTSVADICIRYSPPSSIFIYRCSHHSCFSNRRLHYHYHRQNHRHRCCGLSRGRPPVGHIEFSETLPK
jgi:hypothetical protein